MAQTLSHKKGTSKIIFALVLVISTIIIAIQPSIALADDNWYFKEYEIDYSHQCTEECYKNIYYLTDNPSAPFYMTYFLNGMIDAYAQQHSVFNEFKCYDLLAAGFTKSAESIELERFGEPRLSFPLQDIKDALIIYELNEMLPMQFSDSKIYEPTYELYETFKFFKNKNCKILFICNTDELYFNDCDESNRFLDLVDVHINTDIYSQFAETVWSIYTEGPIEKTTIVLDLGMSQYAMYKVSDEYIYRENWYKDIYNRKYGENEPRFGSRYGFIDGFILPRLRKMFGMFRTGKPYEKNWSVLNDTGINILCYLGGNRFYDIALDRIYEWRLQPFSSFKDDYDSDAYYFIGTTRFGNSTGIEHEVLDAIEDEAGIDGLFDRYVFVEHRSFSYVHDGDIFEEDNPNMHIAGLNDVGMANFIAPIVYSFLFDDIFPVDWNDINNWEGRCRVTVKPTSEDTWLKSFEDPEDTISSEDEDKYYGR